MSKMENGCPKGQPFLEEVLICFIYLRQMLWKAAE